MSKLGANEHVEVGTRAQLPPPAPGSPEAKLCRAAASTTGDIQSNPDENKTSFTITCN